MTDIQQMFVLFYSILYGIMLNSLLGLGPFPVGNALARKDLKGKDQKRRPVWENGFKSCRRLGVSLFLLNICPFGYFAVGYSVLQRYSISADFWLALIQIIGIGLLSIGVFAFFNFFLCFVIGKSGDSPIYTSYEREENLRKRAIYEDLGFKYCLIGGILYLLPLIIVVLGSLLSSCS